MFDNIYDFKRDFNTFLKDYDIKPILMTIKDPQSNALVNLPNQRGTFMIITRGKYTMYV